MKLLPRLLILYLMIPLGLGMTFLSLAGCGAGENDSPTVSTSSTATGVNARLQWNPVNDPSVTGYIVHYGTQSSGQAGLCSYQENQFTNGPSATVTGLDPKTGYYFAVSAYNGLESPCSNEVFLPPSQT